MVVLEPLVNILENKYLNNAIFSERMLTALDEFFQYFKTVLVKSKECLGLNQQIHSGSLNNQGVEGLNKQTKSDISKIASFRIFY